MKLTMQIQNSVDSLDVHPFIQWPGGKGQLLPELNKMIPSQFNRYFEPFLGGAAMFFYLVYRVMKFNAYLSDTNVELITAYKAVKVNRRGLLHFFKYNDI